MDMYLYPFGNPGQPIVLKDVSYGDVSAYMAVIPGQYTVAMWGFGAPASSKPALTTSFTVTAGAAYTLAAIGPDPGLRTEVLKDQMTTAAGPLLDEGPVWSGRRTLQSDGRPCKVEASTAS
jgi:hypothetical protein